MSEVLTSDLSDAIDILMRDAIDILMRDPNPKEVTVLFLEILSKEHRTNQANTIRTMIEILKEYRHASYDLRNESAVKACEEINKLNDDVGLCISYI